MTITRRALVHALMLTPAALLTPTRARAADASGWSTGQGARIRLIVGGPVVEPGVNDGSETWLCGVEIALEAGYKTYWRNAGEGGIPPLFDWSGSTHLADVQVLWPLPERFEGGGARSIGYGRDVIFPVRAHLTVPGRPAMLDLRLDYAACRDLCIPERGAARVALDGVSPQRLTALRRALARVPAMTPPGSLWPVPAQAARLIRSDAGWTVEIAAVAERPAPRDAFLEGPDLWLFGTPDRRADMLAFPVLDRPRQPTSPIELTLTVDDPGGPFETQLTLDAAAVPR